MNLAAGISTVAAVMAVFAGGGPPSGGVPVPPAGSTAPTGTTSPTGGGGLAPLGPTPTTVPAPPSRHAKGHWLSGTFITEYWPAPEAWFLGALVPAPGLPTEHRIDWLYSAQGVSMQGEGIGLDGQTYHIGALGNGGWLTIGGRATSPFDSWAGGPPYWRDGGFWRTSTGGVTFPLQAGGWSAGTGRRYVPLRGVSFAPGASLGLRFWRSIAVDPSVIPLGSEVYIPAYRNDGYGGWFVAQDTGGAINGRHVDVYRSPPASATTGGQELTSQRIYVIKPRK
jgi:3D (Asp-Asp-Asp) domain-containing protein